MPNNPIIGNATIGSVAKLLSGGYANIGGVWKPLVETYDNIGGVWKPAWQKVFTWKKYNVNTTNTYSLAFSTTRETNIFGTDVHTPRTIAKSYSFDSATGTVALSGGTRSYTPSQSGMMSTSTFTTYPYVMVNDVLFQFDPNGYAGRDGFRAVITLNTSHSQGGYVADVESDTENAYPTNGIHTDGYWYVFQS